MNAVVYSEYGGPEVLQLIDVEMPAPGPGEVLVKVHSAAVNPADWHLVRGVPFPIRMVTGGFRRPQPQRRVCGDFSGTIAAIGTGVTGVAVDDPVFGYSERGGALAEYLTVPADKVAGRPERLTFDQAASVPLAGLTALQILRKAQVRRGQHVLIVGAAGGIGTLAVQIAKASGAHVTGVQSTSAVDLVRSLGADRVIDYLGADFTKEDARYDFVFDAVGKSTFGACKPILESRGVYLSSELGPRAENLYLPLITPLLGGKRVRFPVPVDIKSSLRLIKELVEKGKFRPVIDRSYRIEEIRDAFTYVASGRKIGNVLLTM